MASCPECASSYDDKVIACPNDGAALVPDELMVKVSTELSPGTMVGEYRVEEKIGEGGFGEVYRGVQPVIGKPVAIKVLGPELSRSPQVVSRFIAEARAVNQIRHKNIVDIFSFGALPDRRQYFVMELLDGLPLDAYLKKRKHLEPGELLPILRGVLRALAAAHQAGIAHRDLKPENVFLVFDDEGTVSPKLIDFGIAKLLGDESVEHKTRTGTPIGTPYYMSPEQCRGKKVDHRTDLYSVGAMIHVMLTGKRPFDGDSAMDLLYKQMVEAPPRMSEVRPGVPETLDALVLRMLSKSPDDRPATAVDALRELEEALSAAGVAVSDPGRVSIVAGAEARASHTGLSDKTELESAHTLADGARSAAEPTRTSLSSARSAGATPRGRAVALGAAVLLGAGGGVVAWAVSRSSGAAEGAHAGASRDVHATSSTPLPSALATTLASTIDVRPAASDEPRGAGAPTSTSAASTPAAPATAGSTAGAAKAAPSSATSARPSATSATSEPARPATPKYDPNDVTF
jgi:serine/threonine protein kinase